jgi:hypothetical protein
MNLKDHISNDFVLEVERSTETLEENKNYFCILQHI